MISFYFLNYITCPPVIPEKDKLGEAKPADDTIDPLQALEYQKYLKEVVGILEADPDFKKRIEASSVDDIKSGKIADHLDLVGHNVRTQLDELKRKEIERLSKLISRKARINQLEGKDVESILPKHVDHSNTDTFEKGDLEKLIRQATADLEDIDKKRKDEFKKHELEKEYDRRQALENMDKNAREKAEKEYQEEMEKRKHHEKINHPGSKDQLEEVWTEQDKLEEDQFNPNTFFQLHDTDSDGFLNEFEIEALFQIELDKIYNTTDPNYDPKEREEEMNRMREHVLTEIDKNKDKLVSLEEFLEATKQKEFEKNEDWKTIEDEPQFENKEFENYSKTHEPDAVPTTVKLNTEHH